MFSLIYAVLLYKICKLKGKVVSGHLFIPMIIDFLLITIVTNIVFG